MELIIKIAINAFPELTVVFVSDDSDLDFPFNINRGHVDEMRREFSCYEEAKNLAIDCIPTERVWFIEDGIEVVDQQALNCFLQARFACGIDEDGHRFFPLVPTDLFLSIGGYRDYYVGRGYGDNDLCKRLHCDFFDCTVLKHNNLDPMIEENRRRDADSVFQVRHRLKSMGYLNEDD